MSVQLTCRHCGEVIDADDEEALVARVQSHAAGHGQGPPMTREHILKRLHRLQDRHRNEG